MKQGLLMEEIKEKQPCSSSEARLPPALPALPTRAHCLFMRLLREAKWSAGITPESCSR